MANWGDLIEQNGGSRPELYEAIINDDAPDEGTMIEVIIPAFDAEKTWGPMPWMPREPGVMPVEGDRCLVGLGTTPNPGEPKLWIVAWWPS